MGPEPHKSDRGGRGSSCKYDKDLVARLFAELRSQGEVAKAIGAAQGTVSQILLRMGIRVGRGWKGNATQIPLDEVHREYWAGACMSEIAARYGMSGPALSKRMRKAGLSLKKGGMRKPHRNYQWKGGYKIPMHYFRRQSYEVAAICLERPVPHGWVVHHIDENPENNHPDNLILFPSQGHHARHHQRLLKLQRQGIEVDATREVLESGGLALPRPPAGMQLSLGRAQPAPSEIQQMRDLIQAVSERRRM